MVFNKSEIKIMATLFILVLFPCIVLLSQFNSYHKKTAELEAYLIVIRQSNKISLDIITLTESVQNYILSPEHRDLNDFINYSSLTIKDELELYNMVSASEKQNIDDLIGSTKAYISFVENEVMPSMQSVPNNIHNIFYLSSRHQSSAQDLRKKINLITASSNEQIPFYYQNTILAHNNKVKFSLIILLLALILLFSKIFIFLKTLLIHYLYLSKLAQNIKTAVILVNQRGVLKDINNFAQELLGISPDVILQKNIGEIPALFPQLQNVTQPLNDVLLQKKELFNHHITYYNAGRKIELLVNYLPILNFDRLTGAMMVITPAESQKNKHVLLDTLETERKRISIEIHDWIGRHMSTMIHYLDYILRLNTTTVQGELRENITALQSHCQNAAIEMRGIMNDIHPYLIDRVGLISALESYIATFERLNNIKIYILYQDRSLRIKKKEEIIIYRIIQEALSNIAKHSKATEVDINFTVMHDTLKIEVADNGGVTGEYVAGKGFWGMRERANLLGGDIIFNHSGTGFCVTLTIPVLPGGNQNEKDKIDVN